MSKKSVFALFAILLVAAIVIYRVTAMGDQKGVMRIGLAPYQDLAMIVNAPTLKLEEKYGTKIELVTMGWEEILPAVATAGRGLDIGFASYIEYLTKFENINKAGADPIIFVYPLYVYKGGGFVSFRKDIDPLTKQAIVSDAAKAFLARKIGAQKGSLYEMMLMRLAEANGVDLAAVNMIDTPLDQGFLAAEAGSLDVSSAGLTQLSETQRRGGKIVLSMDDIGIADITGFIVKKSTFDNRRKDVEAVVRMWFDSVAFVYADIDNNSRASLAYLDKAASTRYTLDEYKKALSAEYLPGSLSDAQASFLVPGGRFHADTIGRAANQMLLQRKIVRQESPLPDFNWLGK